MLGNQAENEPLQELRMIPLKTKEGSYILWTIIFNLRVWKQGQAAYDTSEIYDSAFLEKKNWKAALLVGNMDDSHGTEWTNFFLHGPWKEKQIGTFLTLALRSVSNKSLFLFLFPI